ncbi:MAG: hypothetical protein QUS33_10925 [Dehalococcoidia bacterium]|nr:hypothetical protein [Dehalococcoidia bacterium]
MDSCPLAHHWIIDALPTRGAYHAICKICGEERDFPENTTPFKFRMPKSAIPSPVVERLLGLPPGSGPVAPGGGDRPII